MRKILAFLVLALACIVIGFIIASQFKVLNNNEDNKQNFVNLERPRTLKERIDEAKEKNEELQNQVVKMRDELDKAVEGPHLAELKERVDRVRSYAGMTELKGPGVKVVLADSEEEVDEEENPNLYILHDEDVLRVINELNAAGAEAICINDHRIIATTEIRCVGPTVLINKSVRLTPPFVIKAIGDSNTLYNSLNMTGGIVDRLEFWGIEVDIQKKEELTVPAYEGGLSFDYAEPVQ